MSTNAPEDSPFSSGRLPDGTSPAGELPLPADELAYSSGERKDGRFGKGQGAGGGDNWSLHDTSKPLRHRHEVLAYMLAAGATHAFISSELRMSQSGISLLSQNPRIKERVEQFKAQHFGGDLSRRIAAAVPKAFGVMEGFVSGEVGGAKTGERLDASKWILEKFSGKPRQEIDMQGGGTVLDLLRALDGLKEVKAQESAQQAAIDVTPEALPAADPLASWVSKLPEEKK